VLQLDGVVPPPNAAVVYTCLGLLRLLKVHLHAVAVSGIDPAQVGLSSDSEPSSPRRPTPSPAATPLESPQPTEAPILEEGQGPEGPQPVAAAAEAGVGGGAGGAWAGDGGGPGGGAKGGASSRPVLVSVRRQLLQLVCRGGAWEEPPAAAVLAAAGEGAAAGPLGAAALGEQLAAEATAVLEVGRSVFFPRTALRQQLLLQLLPSPLASPLAAPLAAPSCSAADLAVGEAAAAAVPPSDAASGRLLADVLMAGFARQLGVSELLLPCGTGEAAAGLETSRGLRLLGRLLDLLEEEATAGPAAVLKADKAADTPPRRRRPPATLTLLSTAWLDLLGGAAESEGLSDPRLAALLLCSRELLERATKLLRQHAIPGVPPALPPGSVCSFLPLLCSGLALLGSHTASFAAPLLPRLCATLEALRAVVPPGADEAHRAHDSLDECRLAEARVCVAEAGGSAIEPDAATEEGGGVQGAHPAPGALVASRHPYGAGCARLEHRLTSGCSCLRLEFDSRCALLKGDHISPSLPISRHISPHLAMSHHTPLPRSQRRETTSMSPHISPYLPISRHIPRSRRPTRGVEGGGRRGGGGAAPLLRRRGRGVAGRTPRRRVRRGDAAAADPPPARRREWFRRGLLGLCL